MNKARQHVNHRRDWGTPDWIIDPLREIFDFHTDLAADRNNRIVGNYYGPDHRWASRRDLLQVEALRPGAAWCNPPYGKRSDTLPGTGDFTKKLVELAIYNPATTIVGLFPDATSSAWFHEFLLRSDCDLWCSEGRIQFIWPGLPDGKQRNGNTGGSILAVWNLAAEILPLPWTPLRIKKY